MHVSDILSSVGISYLILMEEGIVKSHESELYVRVRGLVLDIVI